MLGHELPFAIPDPSFLPMPLLKRPEVWFLLLLATGSLVFALWPTATDGKRVLVTGIAPALAAQAAELRTCTLERDHGNARLDLELHVTNATLQPVLLVPPAAKLLTSAGREVPAFILPTERAPELPAQSQASVTLRYWLEEDDLAGALTLEVQGTKLVVKATPPYDLKKLANAKPQRFTAGAVW